MARSESRRYCDAYVLTYQAERMPEQIRMKVNGFIHDLFVIRQSLLFLVKTWIYGAMIFSNRLKVRKEKKSKHYGKLDNNWGRTGAFKRKIMVEMSNDENLRSKNYQENTASL